MLTDKSDLDGPSQYTRSGTTRDGITPHDDGLPGKPGKGTSPSTKRRQAGNNRAPGKAGLYPDLMKLLPIWPTDETIPDDLDGRATHTYGQSRGTHRGVENSYGYYGKAGLYPDLMKLLPIWPTDETIPDDLDGRATHTYGQSRGTHRGVENSYGYYGKAGLYPDLNKFQEGNEEGSDYEDQSDKIVDTTNDSFDNNIIQAGKRKKNSPSPKSTPKANRRRLPRGPTDETIPDDVHRYGHSRGTHRGVENRYRYRGTEDKYHTDVNSKKNSSGQTAWSLILIIALCIVFVGVSLVMIDRWRSSNDESAEMMQPVDYYQLFKPKFERIKDEFGSQTTRFWKIIGSALKRLMNAPIPTYPAMIIVAVPRGYSSVASCLAKKLVNELNAVFDYAGGCYIDSSTLNDATPAKTKLDLDERLISILSNSHGVVLDHIDILPAQAALLLHGYADGDNAQYKNAAILLVLQSDVKHGEINEKLVEKILTQKWVSVLGKYEILSQIANSIAILSPEESISCDW